MRQIAAVVSFLIALLWVSCSVPTTKTHFLALGDSYTIGESVAVAQRWPEQLVVDLKNKGLRIDSLQIIAKTGWTTDELLQGISKSALVPEYDLVTLMIGVNNQYRGRSLDNFREELSVLMEKSIQFAGGDPTRVFVVSIPDWGVTPFAKTRDRVQISHAIDNFNVEIQKQCQSRALRYIDVTEVSRQAVTDSSLVASDGLHPSGQMYSLWVEKMSPIIAEALHD